MPATPDKIPSDMTLEIGENLSPDRFLAATRAFFGLVEEIAAMLDPDAKPNAWTVVVREGSALIGVAPSSAVPPEVVDKVYSRVLEGIQHLARGDIDGAGLSEPALKHDRTLSELAEGKKTPTEMRLWVQKRPTVIGPKIADTIREDWRADYSDYGAVEGRLVTIQDHGKLEFHVRDKALRQNVKAYFPDDMLDEVLKCFRKRVEVRGVIHYRRNGIPISIQADNIERLPEDHELPTPEDVRGILRIN